MHLPLTEDWRDPAFRNYVQFRKDTSQNVARMIYEHIKKIRPDIGVMLRFDTSDLMRGEVNGGHWASRRHRRAEQAPWPGVGGTNRSSRAAAFRSYPHRRRHGTLQPVAATNSSPKWCSTPTTDVLDVVISKYKTGTPARGLHHVIITSDSPSSMCSRPTRFIIEHHQRPSKGYTGVVSLHFRDAATCGAAFPSVVHCCIMVMCAATVAVGFCYRHLEDEIDQYGEASYGDENRALASSRRMMMDQRVEQSFSLKSLGDEGGTGLQKTMLLWLIRLLSLCVTGGRDLEGGR